MQHTPVLEAVLKRDRAIVVAALVAVTALCWVYLVWMAAAMGEMTPDMMSEGGGSMAMTEIRPWTTADFTMMFLMWAIMMVGMMVPSAAPMVLIFAMVSRHRQEKGLTYVPTAVFLGGYLIAWTAFSAVATLLQWVLDQAALLSPMMVSKSPVLGAGLLIGAGAYQMTPFKNACLKHCRSPMQFVMGHWRNGVGGALRMGVEHGFFCVACCWFLMGLLFFGGVMNLLWIGAIAIFVLLEKVLPIGLVAGKWLGPVMILSGLAVLALG